MGKFEILAIAAVATVATLSGCTRYGDVPDAQRQSLQGKCYQAYAELSVRAAESKLGPDTALALAISETAASGKSRLVELDDGFDDGSLRDFVYGNENSLQNRSTKVSPD